MEEIPPNHRLPLLLLTNTNPKIQIRMLCNFTNGHGYEVDLGTKAIQGRTCCVGSSEGWIMFVDSNLDIYLLNPISRAHIKLPPQPTFEHQHHTPRRNRYIHKIVLSSSSSSSSINDCVILAIHFEFRNLAFWRPGSPKWTTIETFDFNPILDVIFYKGNFYAVSHRGILLACVLDDPVPRVKHILEGPRNVAALNKYLVNAFDEALFLVTRFVKGEDTRNTTLQFKVYILVQVDDESKDYESSPFQWKKVTNLRNLALFVGRGSSLCFSADDCPGCKRNCIYFTDDFPYLEDVQVSDIGVFNYGDGKVEKLCPQPLPHSVFWPPIWVKPN